MPNTRPRLEAAVGAILFASRWILAPFYLGMVVALLVLLFVFLPLGDPGAEVDNGRLRWMVIIHLTFIASGVFMAATDWITSNTKQHAEN